MTQKSVDGTFPCELCGQSYKHVCSWNRHRKMCSEKYDIEKIENELLELKRKLEEGLIDPDEYKKNSEVLNLQIKERKESRKYQCIHCKKGFHVQNYCVTHMKHCPNNDHYINRRKNPELLLKFQCEHCSVRFMSPFNFANHKETCSRLMQYFTWEGSRYVCNACQSHYYRTSKAWEHFRLCNPKKLKHKCNVEGCDFKYSQTKWWVRHMSSCHSSDIHETKIFEDMQSFLNWKMKEERKDFTFFKKISSCKLGKEKTLIYYYCHFRGQQPNSKTKTTRRKSDSIVDYKCPARINLIKTPNLITANYIKSHSHPITPENVKYQNWTPETRERIKYLLTLGYTPEEIKENFKQYVGEVDQDIPLKEHYITTRQISSFKYSLPKDIFLRKKKSKSSTEKRKISTESSEVEGNKIMKEDPRIAPQSDTLLLPRIEIEDYTNERCEVVDSSNFTTDASNQLPQIPESGSTDEPTKQESCNLREGLPLIEEKKALCKVLLKQLEEFLNNEKLNCYVSQMYDSLKEIADIALLLVENDLMKLVDCSSTQAAESCSIEIVDTTNDGIADLRSFVIEANGTKQDLIESYDSSERQISCLTMPSDDLSGHEEHSSDLNKDVILVYNNSPTMDCDRSEYIWKGDCIGSVDVVVDESLYRPHLTVGPFKINRLELKSLDMSISDDELALLNSTHDHLYEKGCLNDTIIDSFLYVLCLKKTSFETIESWKAQSIIEGYREEIKISKKQTVFIPLKVGHHWILYVVNIPNKRTYVFDSQNIKLTEEHLEIAGKIMVFLNKKLNYDENISWMIASPNRAMQNNAFDCGVYLCYYAIRLVKGLSLTEHCNAKELRRLIYNALVICGKDYGNVVDFPL